jgi:secreted PhoX family phosphatase
MQGGGAPTPQRHDGMAVVAARGQRLTLVRNHEIRSDDGAFASGELVYDPAAGGGTTTLEFDAERGRLLRTYPSLAGTAVNCAGGPTPWGSWLSGEETVRGPGDPHYDEARPLRYQKVHGFIFEVAGDGAHAARPLPALGRFTHEAAAVDPATGIVYLTEDRPEAGFYRCVPKVPGQLEHGGKLEMLAARDATGPVTELARGLHVGADYGVRWVPIDDPLLAHTPGTGDTNGVYAQGHALGGTRFVRLEGCAFGGGVVHFTSTSGGDAGRGQVWRYDPRDERLTLRVESADAAVLDNPDNLTMTPHGALVLCEDGGDDPERLITVAPDGRTTIFARNAVRLDGEHNGLSGDFRDQEFAGVCFSPDGRWMFVNIQVPGISFAITGPWAKLGL